MARRVLISASVKSEANHPSSSTPSTIAVRRRLANSGWLATSVVVLMFGSWRAIRCPSRVMTRSGSMKSAPSFDAERIVLQRVIRKVFRRSAAVTDDERRLESAVPRVGGRRRRDGSENRGAGTTVPACAGGPVLPADVVDWRELRRVRLGTMRAKVVRRVCCDRRACRGSTIRRRPPRGMSQVKLRSCEGRASRELRLWRP